MKSANMDTLIVTGTTAAYLFSARQAGNVPKAVLRRSFKAVIDVCLGADREGLAGLETVEGRHVWGAFRCSGNQRWGEPAGPRYGGVPTGRRLGKQLSAKG